MVLSRQQCTAIMTHILETVFDQPPDSNLHKSLRHNAIVSPHDLCSEDDAQLDGYRYPTAAAGVTEVLPRGNVGLLRSFKKFVAYKNANGQPIEDTDWLSITKEEFDAFRITQNFPQAAVPPAMKPAMHAADQVQDF